MTRILLVNAPSHEPGKVLNKIGRWIPGEQLGLCYLAAVLRGGGHTVEIWDAFIEGWSAAEVASRVYARIEEFDVVGVSVSDGKVVRCDMGPPYAGRPCCGCSRTFLAGFISRSVGIRRRCVIKNS